MSKNTRKENQRQPVERIIPIQIEGMQSKLETTVISSESSDPESEEKCNNVGPKRHPNMELSGSSNGVKNQNFHEEETSDEEVKSDNLPSYGVPEKIIIVYDRAQDEQFTHFELKTGKMFAPAIMIKHSLNIFLRNKNAINQNHEYALMILNENGVSWIQDFTTEIQNIIDRLEDIPECDAEDVFDLNSVFEAISSNVKLYDTSNINEGVPPPYTIRTLFLYSRSYTIPTLKRTKEISELLDFPYFIFDVCMTHEPPSSSNHSNKIFEILQNIDKKGLSYYFSVHRCPIKLYIAMAKLLSHPLQRPSQSRAKYSLKNL